MWCREGRRVGCRRPAPRERQGHPYEHHHRDPQHPGDHRHRHGHRDGHGQARHGRDAEGRRHHGRRHGGTGQDRRGRRRGRRHGPRARPGRHPRPGRRLPHERPRHDRRDHRRGLDPGDGQGPDRPLRRGPGAAGAGRGLHRRVRGALPGGLRPPHRQAPLHRALRVRRDEPRRGPAAPHRGGGHDPLQGRGRHRRRLRGHQAHPYDHRGDPGARGQERGRAVPRREGPAGPVRAGQGGRRDRHAARGAVHRRWRGHSRRCRDDDAAGGRRGLRRLRHLQVRQPGRARRRDRQGDDLLRRSVRDRRGLARARRGDGRHQRGRPPRPAPARRARLVSSGGASPLIGILSLQGDVREHAHVLAVLDAQVTLVRRPTELDGLDGLVLPGGESTAITRLARTVGLLDPLRAAIADGLPVLGTCAGLILLADHLADGAAGQDTIGGLDVTVRRNAFGAQIASFETDLEVPALGPPPVRAAFIRAPLIEQVGPGASALAVLADGRVVAAEQGNLLGVAFHPESTGEIRFHRRFLDRVASR
ncbi:pyridoxal 5'-phosphate synthase glutaminase subunit PdxT [Brachybacterium alimentarium]|nr:pyridoxal 5'-phosphate synthase glutaminase subunit PdxT [Brachybacterium alimentarium]